MAYLPTAGPGRSRLACRRSDASTSPASSKARKAAYRMILEAFWKGDLEADAPACRRPCLRDLRRRGRAAREGRPGARQPPGRDRAGGDRRRRSSSATWRVVTVRFEADIAAVTRNADGEVVAGSLSDAVQTRDLLDLPPRHRVARSQLAADRDRRGRVSALSRALARSRPCLLLSACATRRSTPPAAAGARAGSGADAAAGRRRPAAARQCGRGGRGAGRSAAASSIAGRCEPRAAGVPHELPGAAAAARTSRADHARRLGSGLCAEAATRRAGSAAAFFRDRFDWVVGRRRARPSRPAITSRRSRLADAAARAMTSRSTRVPPDLIRCTRADGADGQRPDRRDRRLRPLLHARRDRGRRAGRHAGSSSAWAADPVELFFLQIQGSGRVLLPDGSVMRIGYADQNGREYVAIGRLLRERGILPAGRRDDAGDRRLDARQPGRGQGADARESELHLLQAS